MISNTQVASREAVESKTGSNIVEMAFRVYILLSICDGKICQAAQAVRGMPGVTIADPLEGNPNLLLMVEATDRLELAGLLMPALSVLDGIAEDLRLLVKSPI